MLCPVHVEERKSLSTQCAVTVRDVSPLLTYDPSLSICPRTSDIPPPPAAAQETECRVTHPSAAAYPTPEARRQNRKET